MPLITTSTGLASLTNSARVTGQVDFAGRFSFSLQRGDVSKRILEWFADLRSQMQTFQLAFIVAVALAIQEDRNMSDGDAM